MSAFFSTFIKASINRLQRTLFKNVEQEVCPCISDGKIYHIQSDVFLPSLILMIATFDGWTGTWYGAPLALFFVNF